VVILTLMCGRELVTMAYGLSLPLEFWAGRVAVILILASCMLIRVQLARRVSSEFGLSEP